MPKGYAADIGLNWLGLVTSSVAVGGGGGLRTSSAVAKRLFQQQCPVPRPLFMHYLPALLHGKPDKQVLASDRLDKM